MTPETQTTTFFLIKYLRLQRIKNEGPGGAEEEWRSKKGVEGGE